MKKKSVKHILIGSTQRRWRKPPLLLEKIMTEQEMIKVRGIIKIAQPKSRMLNHDLERIAQMSEEKGIRYIKGLDAIHEQFKEVA